MTLFDWTLSFIPFEKSTNVPAVILPVTASPEDGAVKVITPVL